MTDEVLYFPYLSLPNSDWVNPAALFFEKIDVISPAVDGGIRPDELFDRRTLELIDGEVVRPISPGRYFRNWNPDADRRVTDYLVRKYRGHVRQPRNRVRLHIGKLTHSMLLETLMQERLCDEPNQRGWLYLEATLAAEVMAYLALGLSQALPAPVGLVTDSVDGWKALFGSQPLYKSEIGGLADTLDDEMAARVAAVMVLLPVPPWLSAAEIVRFRHRYRNMLHDFRSYTIGLVAKFGVGGRYDWRSFERALDDAERVRNELARILEEVTPVRAARRIAMAAIQPLAALADNSPWSALAAVPSVLSEIAREHGRHEQKYWANRSPLAYAAVAQRAYHF